jgi:lipopolysaccharide export system protein LptA
MNIPSLNTHLNSTSLSYTNLFNKLEKVDDYKENISTLAKKHREAINIIQEQDEELSKLNASYLKLKYETTREIDVLRGNIKVLQELRDVLKNELHYHKRKNNPA